MKTAYDWITVLIFAGLVARFLQQSAEPDGSNDSVWHYLPPCVGCAGANWLGNQGLDLPAIAVLAATLGYIYVFLGPGRAPRDP
jgi:hypothetical protein